MTHSVLYTDLDDTLFSTLQKQKNKEDLVQVTESKNGRHSYMDATQQAFLKTLKNMGTVVPVTARGSASFDTVSIDFGHKIAVLANGAIIRDENGTVDQTWFKCVKKITQNRKNDLKKLKTFLDNKKTKEIRYWIQKEQEESVYLIIKTNKDFFATHKDAEIFLSSVKEELVAQTESRDCLIHLNGNNLTITPNGISKKSAVDYLIHSVFKNTTLTFGVGDSKTDMPFMALCDAIIAPKAAQLIMPLLQETQ